VPASGSAPGGLFPAWRVVWRGPGDGLSSLAAVSKDNAWAVGINSRARGYLLHWGGTRWRQEAMPSTALVPLVVRASSASDVWVFGAYAASGAAFRWDGSRWHQTSLPAARGGGDAAVLGPSDVWFGYPNCQSGARCPAYHWDGSSWTAIKLPRRFVLTGLSGSAPGNLWVAGFLEARAGAAQGVVAAYRWLNGSWSRARLPRIGTGGRFAIAAPASSNVWIALTWTARPLTLHWNGASWRRLPVPAQSIELGAPIAPFGRDGIRVGATALWNGRGWQFGPPLIGGFDIATVPGTTSAWMVGAWQAPRTGLTAEVRFSA
jgi:hypothetical protein